jgi:hypothetical protein
MDRAYQRLLATSHPGLRPLFLSAWALLQQAADGAKL